MYDVFISYARKERNRAEPLKHLVESLGLKVFFDLNDIDAGDEFPDIIDKTLKQSSVVIGIWSSYSLTRPWVKRECRVAHARGVLVPVALESLDPLKDIPTEFFGLNYLEFSSGEPVETSQSWKELETIIQRRLGLTHNTNQTQSHISLHLLRRPKIYISDCGVPKTTMLDLKNRLENVGFNVGETKYSGYYIDVATEYYEQFDIAIVGFGRRASDAWSHAVDERSLLPTLVHVYFDPVDMSNTGYGAPLSGYGLALEDWARRPEVCFAELLPLLKEILIKEGWTIFQENLPHIEIVFLDHWGSAVSNWAKPLRRAGFTLREQVDESLRRLSSSQLGQAQYTLFVWGDRATEEDAHAIMQRAKKGAAVIAQVDHGFTIPDQIKEEVDVFDLYASELNKSVVGTDEWERMIVTFDEAIKASNRMAAWLKG